MGDGFDLVIFDCDGVLVDSEGLSARVLIALLAEWGIEVDFDHFCGHFLGRSFPTVVEDIARTFDVVLPPEFEQEYRLRLLGEFEAGLHPTTGIFAALDRLGKPYCLATSSSPQRCATSLSVTGLAPYFAGRIFTASQVARGKPAPDLFLHAAASMGVAAGQCLVIEDSLPGIAAARAAGMPVWRYTGGAHLRDRVLKHDDDVPVFDSWEDFPQIMVHSRRSAG